MKVNLGWYDWIVISSSSGKDSQAMLDVVVRLADQQGVSRSKLVVVHCDLGDMEWEGTKELAREHAAAYGLRFEVVRRERGDILQQVLQRHESLQGKGKDAPPWASNQQRWCTSDQKRGPVSTLFTRLAGETRGKNRPARILNCMGMRAGESCAREKLKPFKLDKKNTNGRRTVHVWLPIHGWTEAQVWERISSCPTKPHYAYELGMPRLSCVLCIFSPRNALMLAGKHNRDLLDRYCSVEEQVGYTFQQGLSLKSVRDALDRGEEPGPIGRWEMP